MKKYRSEGCGTVDGDEIREEECETSSVKVVDVAVDYWDRGWQPIPIPKGEKAPRGKGWQRRKYRDEKKVRAIFAEHDGNIGVLLGEPSGGLVDVDLDSEEARVLAPCFLPETCVFGRPGNPESHWIYRCPDADKSAKFQFSDRDKPSDKSMLVELRSTGGQTVFPPSIHPSGERVAWVKPPSEAEGTPIPLPFDELKRHVSKLAAAALLARYWPAEGSRHFAAGALAGCLAKAGWSEKDARHFVQAVAIAAGDEDAQMRDQFVKDTFAKNGQKSPVTGQKTLEEIFGTPTAKVTTKWLGITNRGSVITTPPESTSGKPVILIVPDRVVVNDAGIAALATVKGLYQRAGKLVRIQRSDDKLQGPSYKIEDLPNASLRELLSSCAEWYREGRSGWVQTTPTADITREVESRGRWSGIRPLKAIVKTAVLRPDGTVLTQPGYDDNSSLILRPVRGEDPVPVPEHPTASEVEEAKALLLDVVQNFPFESEVHKAGWLAALLTPLARFAFSGCAPLFLFDASTPGTGKSLLATITAEIALGGSPRLFPPAGNQEEERKRVTAVAREGSRLVLIDNVEHDLGSAALCSALTTTEWSDRILGRSDTWTGPLVCIWFATGNNVSLGKDMHRRVCHIRLEAEQENPEERKGFKYPDLLKHVREHRSQLVAAAVTLLRGYQAAGRPAQKLRPWGSYEGWSNVVRATVVWSGFPDPAEARDHFIAEARADESAVADLIEGLDSLGETTVSALIGEVYDEVSHQDHSHRGDALLTIRNALSELIPELRDRKPTAVRLGKLLGKYRGKIHGGRRIANRSSSGKTLWRVDQVEQVDLEDDDFDIDGQKETPPCSTNPTATPKATKSEGVDVSKQAPRKFTVDDLRYGSYQTFGDSTSSKKAS